MEGMHMTEDTMVDQTRHAVGGDMTVNQMPKRSNRTKPEAYVCYARGNVIAPGHMRKNVSTIRH